VYVVLCNVLPGSGYRLRATGKIGEVRGHSNLLRGFGAALAQPCRARTRRGPCRARTRHGRRRCSGERGRWRVEPSWLRLKRTTQHMHKPQEAISGTLAALLSIASSLIEFAEGDHASTQGGSPTMVRHLSELPVVRCPGCNRPMDPQERASVAARLVDIRYVCAVCGMETKRTVKEDE